MKVLVRLFNLDTMEEKVEGRERQRNRKKERKTELKFKKQT